MMSRYGEPKDIDGQCNAHLYIGDNFGDNHATMRCQLPENHTEEHKETFDRGNKPVTITWYVDEKDDEY